MNEKWNKLAEILKTSDNIVFFGGAGTSTETRFKHNQNNKIEVEIILPLF